MTDVNIQRDSRTVGVDTNGFEYHGTSDGSALLCGCWLCRDRWLRSIEETDFPELSGKRDWLDFHYD